MPRRFDSLRALALLAGAMFVPGGCATRPAEPASSPGTTVFKPPAANLAAIQTRHFHHASEIAVLRAMRETVQELGYTVDPTEPGEGVMIARKNAVHHEPVQRTVLSPIGSAVMLTAGLPFAAIAAAKGEPLNGFRAIVWPDHIEYPCIDRLSVTLERGGAAGRCCIARLAIQRGFPRAGPNPDGRFDGGWLVTDPAVYQQIFTRVAARLEESARK